MSYYVLNNGKWVKAERYNLATMKQINPYDDNLKFMGIGLYEVKDNYGHVYFSVKEVKKPFTR